MNNIQIVNKYQNGYIYKIVNLVSNDPFDFYLGSSYNAPRVRFSGHKKAWNQRVNGKYMGVRLYDEFAKYGIDNFRIIVLLPWPCNNKQELVMKEEEMRLQLKPNYNVNRAYLAPELKKEAKKVSVAEYKKNNIGKIQQWKQKWSENNSNKHICEACDYYTAGKSHFDRHMLSRKHKLEYDEYVFDVEMDRMADIIWD
jgi:hypothetical protein